MNGLEAIAVLAAGMGAGAINSIAGSGTLLSFPVLLAVGYSPVTANVSNNIGLVPGSLSGAYAFREELKGQATRARRLAIGSGSGALVGAILLLQLPSQVFDAVIPWLVFSAATLMLLQPQVAARVAAAREAKGRAASVDAGLVAPVVCFVAGIYGGYFGAAQGIILLATLGVLLPDALARTNALKNVLALTVNTVAAVLFVAVGDVAWEAVALIAVGSVLGAFVGANIGRRVSVRALRVFIVCLGYGVALRLLLFEFPRMKIRVGLGLGALTWGTSFDGFGDLVDDLERLRFDSLWLSERATGPAPDPLVALAFAAGRTKKLKLGTSVQVLSGRNPALIAKTWASLDCLSNGRALPAFGLGVADPREQQAFRIARDDRAGWFDEALPLIRRFWTEDSVDHHGAHFSFDGIGIGPKPLQSPPDVWLGGQAPSELRRVGRLGDGWLPSFCTPSDAAAGRLVVEEAAGQAGRAIDPEHFGALVIYVNGDEVPPVLSAMVERRRPGMDPRAVIPTGHKALRAQLDAFVEQGFSKLVVVPAGAPVSWRDELEALAVDVLCIQN